MPIGTELLNPISGPNPGGASLRYDPIYDKIKEARREEDEVPQGDWAREIKKADWPLVVKLCSEALTNKSKDLQLAAWLTEALVRREGFAGLRQGLDLCQGLVEQFWENLYPEPEDGDLELRAAPLDWIGSRLDESLNRVPLVKRGLNWYDYKESRSVGYEADAASSDAKRASREQAVADGKLTAEEFDTAFQETPKDFYQQTMAAIGGCLEAADSLAEICQGKFADFSPSFSGLRDTLEAIRQAVGVLLVKKQETEPDQEPESAAAEEDGEPQASIAGMAVSAGAAAAAPARAPARRAPAGEPADRAEAFERVAAVAAWLRKEDPYNPVPYVMVRTMRWAELRATGSDLDANLLEAPSTELRTNIKRLFNDGSYDELFVLIEEAAAQPCGRGWLDLQRYFCNACDNAGGYDYAKQAVLAELKGLLADYPDLPDKMLLDDTPAANAETRAWLESVGLGGAQKQRLLQELEPPPRDANANADGTGSEEQPPDALQLAKRAALAGRTDEAIAILVREISQQTSGRARFQCKAQLAQVCVAAGLKEIAYPILEGLAEEIDGRKLEGWESSEVLAHALGLWFRCASEMNQDPEFTQKLYSRICRLDPVQALALAR